VQPSLAFHRSPFLTIGIILLLLPHYNCDNGPKRKFTG
jgi:hypothetical protein